MSKTACKGRCSNERTHAHYWQGYKKCNQCGRFINTEKPKCHCCNGVLVSKPKSNVIRVIHLYSYHIILNYKKYVLFNNIREIFDDHVFFKKVVLINNTFKSECNSDVIFIIINYFAGKKYRLARPIGQGNEQIQFIKDK